MDEQENTDIQNDDEDDVVIEEETEEASPEEPQTDERGVPLKNVYAEMSRKIKSMEKRFEETQRRLEAEKDNTIRGLQSRIQELESSKQQSGGPEYSKEDLYRALGEAQRRGETDLQEDIMKRLFEIHAKEQDQKMNAQAKVSAKQSQYNTRAVSLYPQLRDPSSQFYALVAKELDDREREDPGYQTNPKAILDAANAVAVVRPDLVGGGNKVPSANPARRGGFSESGSGKPVTKKRSDEVQIDEKLYNKWKKDYPNMSRESILKRMREYKERANWSLGDAL
jgi:hypothetical protein